jgi:hypothetical protein
MSETVLRGRGPGASGFEPHRRRRIFSKEGTSAGPWMTVGWWKEERHSSHTTARSAGFKSRPDGPPMDVVLLYSCCVVQKGERRTEGVIIKRGTALRQDLFMITDISIN